jgi:hypothetical protein
MTPLYWIGLGVVVLLAFYLFVALGEVANRLGLRPKGPSGSSERC